MGKNDKVAANATAPVPAAPVQSLPLNDDSWDAFVFALSLDNQIGADLSNGRLQSLCEWISGGYRQRFTVIQKSELIAWAVENAKTVDQCKEVKAAIDAGTSESDLPEPLLAKLVKVWLLLSKQEGAEAKLPKKDMDSSFALADDPSKNGKQVKKDDKDKDRVKSSTLKKPLPGAKGPGVPGKADSRPSSPGPAADGKARKNKLRDRVGKADARPVSIGDEPADGPDVYYLLKDFDSPNFFNLLIEEHDVPISAIVRFEDTGNPPPVPTGRKQTPNDPQTIFGGNAQWHSLKSIAAKAPEGSLWRDTAWLTIASTEVKDPKETFDIIAKKIYALLQRKKMYHLYYEKAKLISIPEFLSNTSVKNDLRYYDFLVSSATSHDHLNVDLLLALSIEQLAKLVPSKEEEREPEELPIHHEEKGWLNVYFDRAAQHLATPEKDDTGALSSFTGQTKTDAVKVVPWQNQSLLVSLYLNALESLGINPAEVLTTIRRDYPMHRYVRFLSKLSDYTKLNHNVLLRDALLFKTEVARLNQNRIPEHALERFIYQLEFERLLKQKADAELKKWNLDSWIWLEHHDSVTLAQVMQTASLYKPIVYDMISSRKGGLLVALAGPGPIGALQHSQSHLISVTSKLGFASYNEIVEAHPEALGAPSSGAIDKTEKEQQKCKYAYLAGDQLIRIQEEETFLYPAFDVTIRITKRKSVLYGTESTFTVSWNNNVITFSGESGSKQGARLTVNFADESVFSVSKKLRFPQVNVSASTHSGQFVTFLPDRKILQKRVGGTSIVNTLGQENEIGRTVSSSGKIVRFLESGASHILYPDGSITTQTCDAEFIKTKWDGHTVSEKPNGTKSEYQIKVAREKDVATQTIVLAREDMVLIEIDESKKLTVRHRDGSVVCTDKNEQKVIVESPRFSAITFNSNDEDGIHLDGGFGIWRTYSASSSTFRVEKNGFSIHVDTNGKANIQFPLEGFENLQPNTANVMTIDWIKGTFVFKDLNDADFSIDDSGNVNIGKYEHAAGRTTPIKSFGGRLLKERVRMSTPFSGSGNTPRLFFVHVDGSGRELLRDEDVLSHFQANGSDFDQCNEELTGEPGSLGITTISKLKNRDTNQPVLLFRQLTRFSGIEPGLRRKLETDLKVLEARKAVLTSVPGTEDDSPHVSHPPVTGNDDSERPEGSGFIFGQNRAATEEAIVLKYMLRQDLAVKSANSPYTPEKKQNLKPKEMSWTKPRALKVNRVKKELTPEELKRVNVTAHAKLDKVTRQYFQSPEGIQFLSDYQKLLQSQSPSAKKDQDSQNPAATTDTTPVPRPTTSETISVADRPKTAPEPAPLTDMRPTTGTKSEPGDGFTIPPESTVPSSIPVPVVLPTPSTDRSSSSAKPSAEPKTVTINETPIELTTPAPKAGRKLPLPAVLKASKPGAVPNTAFEKEKAFARQVRTASTTLAQKTNDNYCLGGFVVLPTQCRFGKVMQGKEYSMKVFMTNIGVHSARYNIRQPKNKSITVEFKPGPVAPGMKTVLTVKLIASSDMPTGTSIQDEFQVVSETEILHIPIHTTVLTEQAFYDRVDDEVNPIVELASTGTELAPPAAEELHELVPA